MRKFLEAAVFIFLSCLSHPAIASGVNLQVQFLDDAPILDPEGGYIAILDDINIGMDDGVCVVHNNVLPGLNLVDMNGFGKIRVTFVARGVTRWMTVWDVYNLAVSKCQKEMEGVAISATPKDKMYDTLLAICLRSVLLCLKKLLGKPHSKC